MRMLVTAKSAGEGAGAACAGCGTTETGAGVWAEQTAEPAHTARVITNPNRFMNRLPARVLLEIRVEYRWAWRRKGRLRMYGPHRSATRSAELHSQVTRFGIGLQDIIDAADSTT